MNAYQHAATVLLIHDMKVRAETARDTRQRLQGGDLPQPDRRGNRNPRVRRALSNGLFAMARRIAPTDGGLATDARH